MHLLFLSWAMGVDNFVIEIANYFSDYSNFETSHRELLVSPKLKIRKSLLSIRRTLMVLVLTRMNLKEGENPQEATERKALCTKNFGANHKKVQETSIIPNKYIKPNQMMLHGIIQQNE